MRAGGDRRRLGRSLALPSEVRGREGEPPCEPAGIGDGSDGASPSQNGSIPTTRGIPRISRLLEDTIVMPDGTIEGGTGSTISH